MKKTIETGTEMVINTV